MFQGHARNNLCQGFSQIAEHLPNDTGKTDPDLAAIVAAWSELPEAIRAGIVAMVKAASGSRPDRAAKALGCEEGEV